MAGVDEMLAQKDLSLPRCQKLSELRSQSQELLHDMANGTGDVLRVAEAPNLQGCHLLGDGSSALASGSVTRASRPAQGSKG